MSSAKLTVSQEILIVDLGQGVSFEVDLKENGLSEKQVSDLEDLFSNEITLDANGDVFVAQLPGSITEDEKFARVRDLKVSLGKGGQMAGLICDFGLKCVVV